MSTRVHALTDEVFDIVAHSPPREDMAALRRLMDICDELHRLASTPYARIKVRELKGWVQTGYGIDRTHESSQIAQIIRQEVAGVAQAMDSNR